MREINLAPLRVILIAGLILFAFTGAALTTVHFLDQGGITAKKQDENFAVMLRAFDSSAQSFTGSQEEYEKLDAELERLEKKAIGVESWLSVLKRRRAFSQSYPQYQGEYVKSIRRALKIYPLSQPLAAVAAAAFLKEESRDNRTDENIRELLALLTDPAFNTLRLSSYILLGDFVTSEKANVLPAELFPDGTEAVILDLTILKIIRADIRGAAADIQTYMNTVNNRTADTEDSLPSAAFFRFAAEYYYDFGDLSRSAELFSRIDDDASLLRQADALYLAGFTESARAIWSILARNMNGNSLYNMAATSRNPDESLAWLERLVKNILQSDNSSGENTGIFNLNAEGTAEKDERSLEFGLIRYSRSLDYNRAIALLESTQKFNPANNPYIDLETIKRRSSLQEPGRQAAETWLLLDRHPDNEHLYQWAAWLFFLQRYYGEAKILLNRNETRGDAWEWANVYRAIQFMQEGRLETAENLLRGVSVKSADWPVFANLGRILEAQLYTARALEQYELAAAKLLLEDTNKKGASKVQYRIARCLSALGRGYETPRVLEYALDLDPENHTARLELDRMNLIY
ncbi:MAG: hypothetical protein LBH16_04970 [Treponema sp.]|jgi:tetratricopeptide (TPR) repeat protein|nr:hypothetical protein [Treponema sp.]